MLESASQLDDSGKLVTASRIDEHVQRIVTAGYGGGIAEYIGKLLELARNKGIDYMQNRMQEERIVTLNDGTPVLKQNDAPWLINAVVARARSLKLPETKGMKPFAPGKKDSGWSDEASKRLEEIKSGKSSWLNQAKPFSDAMEEKKRKKLKWEPPKTKSEKPSSAAPVAKPASAPSKPTQSVSKPASAPKSTSAPKKEAYYGSQDKLTSPKKEEPTSNPFSNPKLDNPVQSWLPPELNPLNKR